MQPEMIEEIEREIERLRRRYAAFMREAPDAREVIARWAAEAAGLCWFVPLEDVVEPDIDVEITREVLIVRANRTWPEPASWWASSRCRDGFDPEHPVIRFTEETLEVRIRRVRPRVQPMKNYYEISRRFEARRLPKKSRRPTAPSPSNTIRTGIPGDRRRKRSSRSWPGPTRFSPIRRSAGNTTTRWRAALHPVPNPADPPGRAGAPPSSRTASRCRSTRSCAASAASSAESSGSRSTVRAARPGPDTTPRSNSRSTSSRRPSGKGLRFPFRRGPLRSLRRTWRRSETIRNVRPAGGAGGPPRSPGTKGQFFTVTRPCPACHGTGVDPVQGMPGVPRRGDRRANAHRHHHIPEGTEDGAILRLGGLGGAGTGGGPPGDLLVHVRVRPDPVFRREGNDIHSEVPVPMPPPLWAARRRCRPCAGGSNLTIPPGTSSGAQLRLRGQGVRGGDHVARVMVTVPATLTARQRELLRGAGQERGLTAA